MVLYYRIYHISRFDRFLTKHLEIDLPTVRNVGKFREILPDWVRLLYLYRTSGIKKIRACRGAALMAVIQKLSKHLYARFMEARLTPGQMEN